MKTILLVGFSNFGPYKANTSAEIIRTISSSPPKGFRVENVVYPADIPAHDRGQEVLDTARRVRAHATICLGMASDRKSFTIECQASNLVRHPKYCPPELNGTPVDPKLPLKCELYAHRELKKWKFDRFIEACRGAGFPRPHWSLDAGNFCCNHLMFQILALQKRQPEKYKQLNWAFLHVPCVPQAVPEPGPEFTSGEKILMPVEDAVWHTRLLLEHALPRQRHKRTRGARSISRKQQLAN